MQDWLAQRAARSPERVALFFQDRTWTFRELDARVSQLSDALISLHIHPNDRVAVLLRNSDMFVVLVHAIARVGAVLVPLNTRLTPAEIGWQLAHIRAHTLIYDELDFDRTSRLGQASPTTQFVSTVALSVHEHPHGENNYVPSFQLGTPHSILFTSGTTGKPKAAVLTFGNHWWNAIGSALNLGLHEDDVWLACMPLFHVGGLAIMLRSVIYGIPVVLTETFDARQVNHALDQHHVTIVSMVTTMLRRVIDERGDIPFPKSLRCVLLGGGPAPKELLQECAALNVPVVQTYGLTEAASQVATLAPPDALRKLGSAGKPLMGVDLKIEATDGEVGEILIRGSTVMREYASDLDATTRAWRDGWFHTGDLGYLDGEGYLYVVSRREDLIVSGGENVYPAEIEAVLNTHPAVQESAVVGVSHPQWVQAPIAFVVLLAGAEVNAQTIKTYCAEKLARYKIPLDVVFVDALPRNAAGKLLRRVLAQEWESKHMSEDQSEGKQ